MVSPIVDPLAAPRRLPSAAALLDQTLHGLRRRNERMILSSPAPLGKTSMRRNGCQACHALAKSRKLCPNGFKAVSNIIRSVQPHVIGSLS
jgi:hypothetical protein